MEADVICFTTRHGEKDKNVSPDIDRPLTADGEAAMFGLGARTPLKGFGTISGSHSEGYIRTRNSVVKRIEGALSVNRGLALDPVVSDPGLGVDMSKMFDSDGLAAWADGVQRLGEQGNIQRFLFEELDPGHWPVRQFANGIAHSHWLYRGFCLSSD
jgi:hypothetical protein